MPVKVIAQVPVKMESFNVPGVIPIDAVRPQKVIIVGAGISGITAAILLLQKVPKVDITIVERQKDLVWELPSI